MKLRGKSGEKRGYRINQLEIQPTGRGDVPPTISGHHGHPSLHPAQRGNVRQREGRKETNRRRGVTISP